MKSIVVEIRGQFAAVLSDDGCIVKVKNNNYVIGQEIEMRKDIKKKQRKLAWIACAACVAVVSCVGGGGYAYATPYSSVTLDVNPSIEFSLNRFERIISVKAVNDDGNEIIKEIELDNLNNKKIDKALKITIEQLTKDGYFNGDSEGGVIISTTAKDLKKAAKLAAKLEKGVKEDIAEDDNDDNDSVVVEAISVGKERVAKARELGVTPGKLNLVEKLQASAPDSNYDVKEWLAKPVKDIMKETNKNKAILRNEQKVDQEDSVTKGNSAPSTSDSAIEKNKVKNDKSVNQTNGNAKAVNNGNAKAVDTSNTKTVDNNLTNDSVEEDKVVESDVKDTIKEVKNQEKTDSKSTHKPDKGVKDVEDDEE